jgi:hypothetical protein
MAIATESIVAPCEVNVMILSAEPIMWILNLVLRFGIYRDICKWRIEDDSAALVGAGIWDFNDVESSRLGVGHLLLASLADGR